MPRLIYSLLFYLAQPAVWLRLWWRARKQPEYLQHVGERLGRYTGPLVGAFVVAMFLTPPDVVSQTLLAVPMWLLFEVGLFFGRLIRKRPADEAADDADNDQPPAVQP